MPTPIDCSRMSHAECLPPEEPEPTRSSAPSPTTAAPPNAGAASPPASGFPDFGSYDCINDCVSSLGVAGLLSGTVVGAGCVALPPACPIFLGAGAGAMLGACNAVCVELEKP